jgi:hypothetical protein
MTESPFTNLEAIIVMRDSSTTVTISTPLGKIEKTIPVNLKDKIKAIYDWLQKQKESQK